MGIIFLKIPDSVISPNKYKSKSQIKKTLDDRLITFYQFIKVYRWQMILYKSLNRVFYYFVNL